MKCLNKIITISLILCILALTGCGTKEVTIPYGMLDNNSSYSFNMNTDNSSISLFAKDLCATSSDITNTSDINSTAIYAAAVYDLNDKSVMYSYNANTRINPASLTKLMTALIVMENRNLDDIITVQDVTINEEGAQLFKLKEGDRISIRNLLYVTLVYSGNDASLALAKEIAGSETEFANMMNERAARLGCTGTHFVNPHGLTNEDHYTTAYDLYLIFNECIKHPEFLEIINVDTMEISYNNADGEYITKTIISTDKFLLGDYALPDTVTIIGGKTGSTNAAGKCIILYCVDQYNNPYISVMLGAGDEQTLYHMMTNLLNQVFK